MEFIDSSIEYPNELKLKVTIVGLSKSGKSIFINRLISNKYFDIKKVQKDYVETVCFDLETKKIKIKNKIYALQILDICGIELYESLINYIYI